jgi:prevent-host-death family protein
MKTVGAFEAKTHLSEMLAQVARGESFLITKRGKPMATLSPVSLAKKQGPKDAILAFRRRFAKSLKPTSLKEILELRDFGRK